jgi:hypothetical protein
MAVITAVRKVWGTVINSLGAEEYSLILAVIVVVGLTAITATRP